MQAERSNRFIGSNLKKQATAYSRATVLQAMIDGERFNWPCELKLTWYLPDKRTDPDNWSFTKKFIFDGMQTAKIRGEPFLPNDSIKFITGFHETFQVDKNNPRLEIEEK